MVQEELIVLHLHLKAAGRLADLDLTLIHDICLEKSSISSRYFWFFFFEYRLLHLEMMYSISCASIIVSFSLLILLFWTMSLSLLVSLANSLSI